MSNYPYSFGPRMGTWSVYSSKDPRWNKTGRARGFVFNGGPPEMQTWIDHCKELYGEPPEDCTRSFMKD